LLNRNKRNDLSVIVSATDAAREVAHLLFFFRGFIH